MGVFPVITKAGQKMFEKAVEGQSDSTPMICGYYGRACRQMEKAEGANRALCMGCPLAGFVKKGEC